MWSYDGSKVESFFSFQKKTLVREDSNSSHLKRGRRKVFEDGGGGLTIVPVVEFPNLKRVVNFIYKGQISFWQPGGAEWVFGRPDSLESMKEVFIDLNNTFCTGWSGAHHHHHGELRKWRASSGKLPSLKTCIDCIIQLDVKHIGAQEIEASTSAASQVRGGLGDDDVLR